MSTIPNTSQSRAQAGDLAVQLVTALLARGELTPVGLARVVALVAEKTAYPPDLARFAVEASIARLRPATPPDRPASAAVATQAQISRLGTTPAICWFCGTSSWWRADGATSRWLCARCTAPDPALAVLWHDATEAELEDAAREPSWSETPDRDGYLRLRLRKLAADAARVASDLLGAWRPSSPRPGADLHALDWFCITDVTSIVTAAEELRAWSVELLPAARAEGRKAISQMIGWPARCIGPVLDRALELLRTESIESIVASLGPDWPSGTEPGSPTPVSLRIDENKTVLVRAHPHLVRILRDVRDGRHAAARPASSQSSGVLVGQR